MPMPILFSIMFINERKSFIPLLKHVKQASIQGESGDFLYIYLLYEVSLMNSWFRSTIPSAGFERRRAGL